MLDTQSLGTHLPQNTYPWPGYVLLTTGNFARGWLYPVNHGAVGNFIFSLIGDLTKSSCYVMKNDALERGKVIDRFYPQAILYFSLGWMSYVGSEALPQGIFLPPLARGPGAPRDPINHISMANDIHI